MNIMYWLENDEWPHLSRGSEHAAGWDLIARPSTERELSPGVKPMLQVGGVYEPELTMGPGTRFQINTGLYLAMRPGICAMLCSRSGLALNAGVIVLNAPGIVDADYRGEVKVTLANFSDKPYTIRPGDRVAQIVFVPVFPEVSIFFEGSSRMFDLTPRRMKDRSDLGASKRGDGGFGSTGR